MVVSAIETCVCFTKFSYCVFSSINSFVFFSKLFILISILSNLFSRFSVSLHYVRTCSVSSEKFVITYFLKPLSVNSSGTFSIQPCSLAGWSCDPLEVERHSGFGCFHPFCAGFFPSLWIYLPGVFVLGDFQMGSLSVRPDC